MTMPCMLDMMTTSLVAAVAPHKVKNGLNVFERGENLLQNWHITLFVQPIVRNRVGKIYVDENLLF